MLCPQCRFDNRANVSFCEECGAKLDVLCPSCGAAVPPGRKFCGTCGKALTVQAELAPRFASPEAYTPKHLAEKILTSPAALEGNGAGSRAWPCGSATLPSCSRCWA